ncbi:hypothetical protein GE09DRAFT_1147166 [Coniochaeta sp. 2T2.1]|nr:hypothetical protein GE09DRAFT_1147166 [Coniochaeta sp. 2T2.1]
MPPLEGFSDNPFRTREDLVRAVKALLNPLQQYRSPGKARIKIATATGAGFSEAAAQLEGFARPLWVVPSLLQQSQSTICDSDIELTPWPDGLKTGTDPASPEYWGPIRDFDQRSVETESIAFALLTAPEHFVPIESMARRRLAVWLRQINEQRLPENNWRWFRVFVNLALVKTLGVPIDEVRETIERDLGLLDSFYVGDGWSSDGMWGDERKQADYYSGSFAMQFAQLLYVKLSDGYDNVRAKKYKTQAREFASSYWRYFDANGAAIAFGRSLTYRYAFAAFWAAVGCSEISLPPPLDHPGVVKGLLLRHLRWWSKHPDIFNTDGTHNIGFTYPNLYMSENYNSPQSVYWCLKSFIVLQLAEDHPFWTVPELPHPFSSSSMHSALSPVAALWPPRHILCSTPEHHFLLSSGQFTSKDHKAREAKYGKFAYSSAFGFSVPTGQLLTQIAPDNTLCVSRDDGDSWKVAWEPYNVRLKTFKVGIENAPSLVSQWKPWRDMELYIETTLIAPIGRWPGWHFRVHTFVWSPAAMARSGVKTLRCVGAGFAISSQRGGASLFETPCGTTESLASADIPHHGWWKDGGGALVMSEAGAVGVTDLAIASSLPVPQTPWLGLGQNVHAAILHPDANTNIISPRTLLPTIRLDISLVSKEGLLKTVPSNSPNQMRASIALGVFAVAPRPKANPELERGHWLNRPSRVSLLDGNHLEIS